MNNEINMSNFDWLNTIYPIEYENWHNDNVIRVNQIENYEFYDKRIKNTYKGYINPSDIKGIQYLDSYNHRDDITWKQLLNKLKRFDDIREKSGSYDLLLDHVHSEYRDPKIISKYGNTLITTSGQHRLALAKFLNISSVEVTINEYDIDAKKYSRFKDFCYKLDKLRDYRLANYEFKDYREIWQELTFSVTINEYNYYVNKSEIDRIISIYQSINLKDPILKIFLLFYNESDNIKNHYTNELKNIKSLKLALANHKSMFM